MATPRAGEVSGLFVSPRARRGLLVLAHGAGAGMRHAFQEAVTQRLAARGIATFRYQFPYMERGSRRPDPQPVLTASVRAAISAAAELAGGMPLVAGGKSMGGRMTSLAASEEPLAGVGGLVFFGFPLHPAGKPSLDRAAHLEAVHLPMLFLQGTRDHLADLDLVRAVCARLGARATLHVAEGGDHSFALPKSTARTRDDVLEELADVVSAWMARLVA